MAYYRKGEAEELEIVAILWMDACYTDYQARNTLPLPMLTFGFLLENEDDRVTVAFEVHADSACRHVTTIPKHGVGMSPTIISVGKIKLPASFREYREKLGL